MFEFAKEKYFDEIALGSKSTGDKTLIKLLKSPAVMAGSLKKKSLSKKIETKTRTLSFNHNELCDRLKLLLQEIQAGNISNIIIENIAIADKLSEYKCISKKQHRFLIGKRSNSKKSMK